MKKKNLKDNTLDSFLETMNHLSIIYSGLEVLELENKNEYAIEVKSKGSSGILSSLKLCLENINNNYQNDDPKISVISDELKDRIKFLNKNYSIKSKWLGVPETLRDEDVTSLSKDIGKWIDKLFKISGSQIVLETKKNAKKISPALTKGLNKSSKEDLNEAFQAMDYGLFTAAYMLFFRVAENEIIRLYQKVTKTKPTNLPWGNMLEDLRKYHYNKLNHNIRNIAYYLKNKRNEAQHPGKRFTENDCEKIYIYLSDLKIEIDKLKI